MSAEPDPIRPDGKVPHIVLVEPEIAANTGAIGRTCVALAAPLWLVRPLGFIISDHRIRRAGLDYWEHLDLRVVDSLDDVLRHFGSDRLWLFTTKAARPYTDADFQPADALVFGPESRGLSKAILQGLPDRALRIPLHPAARSLNLGAAVAVAGYEAVRQLQTFQLK